MSTALITHPILILSVLILFLFLSKKIVAYLNLEHAYISIPYMASFLCALTVWVLSLWIDVSFLLPLEIEMLFVSLFLLTIGVHIGIYMSLIYIKRALKLLILCGLIILGLHASRFAFNGDLQWIFGSAMFAFNAEMISRIVPSEYQNLVYFWGKLQMAIVFGVTPLYIYTTERAYNKIYPQPFLPQINTKIAGVSIWRSTTLFLYGAIIIGVWALIYMQSHFAANVVPFLFHFVPPMMLGIAYGKWILPRLGNKHRQDNIIKLDILGTWSLYAFIVASMMHIPTLEWSIFDWQTLSLLLIKTVLIAILSFYVVYLLNYRTKSSFLVAAAAGWTFTLSAPVVCMHAMRSVVNKDGPAPEVLLLIPPVILWLVNYVHLLLLAILEQ